MTVPSGGFGPFLQDAADRYAAGLVATATGPLTQQLATAQTQSAALQAQLANALAADTADRALVATLQGTVASLQAQLAALAPGKAPATPAGWAVAFQDDFNAPALDTGKWTSTTDTASNELSARTPANVLAGPDHLTIRAQRQTVGTRAFSSGYITTAGKFSVPFGRWLIRARWDDSFGLWPALWLRDDTGLGEIDIMEAVGSVRKVIQTVHQSTNGDMDKSGHEWPMPAGWAPGDWHVYGVQRDNTGTLTWTIDGQTVFTRTRADLGSVSHQAMTWLTGPTFPAGQHMICNLQVGGTMPNYYITGSSSTPIDPAKILPGTAQANLDLDWVQVLTPLAAA